MSQHRNGRSQRRGRGAKDDRIRIAEGRNEAWHNLSAAEQIASLKGRRGSSKHQLIKLGAYDDTIPTQAAHVAEVTN